VTDSRPRAVFGRWPGSPPMRPGTRGSIGAPGPFGDNRPGCAEDEVGRSRGEILTGPGDPIASTRLVVTRPRVRASVPVADARMIPLVRSGHGPVRAASRVVLLCSGRDTTRGCALSRKRGHLLEWMFDPGTLQKQTTYQREGTGCAARPGWGLEGPIGPAGRSASGAGRSRPGPPFARHRAGDTLPLPHAMGRFSSPRGPRLDIDGRRPRLREASWPRPSRGRTRRRSPHAPRRSGSCHSATGWAAVPPSPGRGAASCGPSATVSARRRRGRRGVGSPG
jgi:hypothetical protein